MTTEQKEKEEVVIKIEQEPEVIVKKKSIERRSLGFTLTVLGTVVVVAGYAICRIARSLK